jgi:hypothetical protein
MVRQQCMANASNGLRRQNFQGREEGDLPVQAPTKYELVINVKTALM